jgi:hypothetical protein
MPGYPNTLKYFMWKWQVHFMISCKVATESIFNKVDDQLQPTSFLIGFKIDKSLQTPEICFEPEKMAFLQKDLIELGNLATQYNESDPQNKMFFTGGMQGEMDDRRYRANFRKALKDCLDVSDSFNDKIHFVSHEVKRDGFKVFVILQLKKSIYLNYKYLSFIDPEEIIEKHLSLIEAIVYTYLEDMSYRLYIPEAGKDDGPKRSSDEILRASATNFLFTIGFVGSRGGFLNIPPACEALSLQKYEGKENVGHLIVCRKEHPALEISLELDSPFPINDYRKIRKLLELTSVEIGVVTDGSIVFGLGHRLSTYNSVNEDFFDIHFRGLHCYDVVHVDQPVLLMRHGNTVQVRQLIDKTNFFEIGKRIFPGVTEDQLKNLHWLSIAATQSGKGCMLVFAGDASSEAKRLANQCISIKPNKLDIEMVGVLTSIDGALLIDLDGFAHAKGVILDGVVGLEGDASRGSRYNSGLTYYEYRSLAKPTMIIIVSEDGMVDVIPKLMPQIRHSEIIQFIKTLESLNSPETFNDTAFYNTMDLLDRRSFYLTADECKRINKLRISLKDLDDHSGKTMWRVFDDFQPNPRMNSSYYLPEI